MHSLTSTFIIRMRQKQVSHDEAQQLLAEIKRCWLKNNSMKFIAVLGIFSKA